MEGHTKTTTPELSIGSAIETLSYIADVELQGEQGLMLILPSTKEPNPKAVATIDWIQTHDANSNIHRIREILRVVLIHLRNTYKKESQYTTSNKTIEGIKSIMLLVSEAAKKMDEFLHELQENKNLSITQLKEYKLLQEFYRKKIDKIIDESILSRWILGLTKTFMRRSAEEEGELVAVEIGERTSHVFVDLETVRNDTEYELLLMRKEDGSRFFNPRLLRNIKLVCEFGSNLLTEEGVDPLSDVTVWQDKIYHSAAKDVLRALGNHVERFYKETVKHREMELVVEIRKAFMALMLAANANNLQEHHPVKNCKEYFTDFQNYLRKSLLSRDYQKIILYAGKSEKLHLCLLETVQKMCSTLYLHLKGLQEIVYIVDELLQNARKKGEHLQGLERGLFLWSRMAYDYDCLVKEMKFHPNGPLKKAMDFIEEGEISVFDPLLQYNLPNKWFELHVGDRKIDFLRMPSPTLQSMIHKAVVSDEFKALLYYYNRHHFHKKHLLLNLQDRTSWREYSRCTSLEQLQKNSHFSKYISVATFAVDTDFYNQLPPYDKEEEVELFFDQLKEHLDEASGFCFPEAVGRIFSQEYIDTVLHTIHGFFFEGKKTMTQEEKVDFISLFYLLTQLKLIEATGPSTVSLTCKDSVDMSPLATAQLFLFLKLLNQEGLSEADSEYLNFMIYAPALVMRERLPLTDVFNRFLDVVKRLEMVKESKGKEFIKEAARQLDPLFSTPILHGTISLHLNK